MSCHLRWEQCCETDGCKRPARHGVLCPACFLAATPARRAVEMVAAEEIEERREAIRDNPSSVLVNDEGVAWLRELWAA